MGKKVLPRVAYGRKPRFNAVSEINFFCLIAMVVEKCIKKNLKIFSIKKNVIWVKKQLRIRQQNVKVRKIKLNYGMRQKQLKIRQKKGRVHKKIN